MSKVPTVPASRAPRPRRELTLDAVDVDAVGNDQPGIALERGEEPLEQVCNLAGMCRPDDEREPHLAIVVLASEGAVLRPRKVRVLSTSENRSADFGFRPLRATALPGIPPAQPSQSPPPSRLSARR